MALTSFVVRGTGVANFSGKFQIIGSGGRKTSYDFDGASMYIDIPDWECLGDPAVYESISYDAENDQGYVVGAARPITELGRVGANYHDGVFKNVQMGDSSPIQDTQVKKGSIGTLPDIDMGNGWVSFDMIAPSSGDIIAGYISIAGGVLSLSANASGLLVDGQAYAGAAIGVGQHCAVRFDTSGGTLSQVSTTAGMANLLIQTHADLVEP